MLVEYGLMKRAQVSSVPEIDRVKWVDAAKGLGIILVVLGHVLRGVVASDLIAPTPAVQFVDAWIYAFHMPLFFFVSGLFLSRSTAKPAGEFAWNKLATIAYPYFVWSLVTLLIKSPLGQVVNQPRTLSEIPSIFYHPIEQFWFLYVLFLLTIAFGFLLKFGVKPWVIVFVGIVLYPGIWPLPWSGWAPFELARINAIYLALGVIAGDKGLFRLLRGAGARLLVAVVATGFLIVTSLAIFLESSHPHALDFVLAVSGTAAIVTLALLANRAKVDSAIGFLGRYSLEIFVGHTIASGAIRIIFQTFGHGTNPALYILFGTVAGLYGPVLLAIFLKRIGFMWAFTLPRRKTAAHYTRESDACPDKGNRVADEIN